jgi:hypothetical protein
MNAAAHVRSDDRREYLRLACQLDRLNLRLAVKPAPVAGLALSAVEMLAAATPGLAGLFGRRAKAIMRCLSLIRGIFDALAP